MGMLAAVMVVFLAAPAVTRAEVLCARSKNGVLGGTIKIRSACKRREVQVDLAALGACCGSVTTTTTVSGGTTSVPGSSTTTVTSPTSTLTCPTFTTTTLGVNICGGSPPNCNGLCANARVCENDGVACSCTGATLPCGVVTNAGACGGACPASMQCAQVPVVEGSCQVGVTCGCVPS